MPFPIKPMHELEEHNELFGYKQDDRGDISSLQMMFLDGKREAAAKPKYSEDTLNLLETIYNSVDKLTSAASEFASNHREASVLYKVPDSINDNELLSLKTAGLISGMGRTVKLTESGKVALRDKWLSEENQFEANRTKDKFELRTSSPTGKFKKIS